MTSTRARIADQVDAALRATAAELGRHPSQRLLVTLRQICLECYRRGAYDTHERDTVSPPTDDPRDPATKPPPPDYPK
jgi:hypothetical protein